MSTIFMKWRIQDQGSNPKHRREDNFTSSENNSVQCKLVQPKKVRIRITSKKDWSAIYIISVSIDNTVHDESCHCLIYMHSTMVEAVFHDLNIYDK